MKNIFVLAMVMLGIIALSASAEIKFVNRGSESEEIKAASKTSLTLSAFDAGSGADTYIVVSVTSKLKDEGDNPVVSVTFGGEAVPPAGSEFVDDYSYKGWANLYIAPASGIGDVVVEYEPADDDPHDGISVSVASYSGVAGIGATSRGENDKTTMTELSDSIKTTADNSLIVSSLMQAGNSSGSMNGIGKTKVRVDNDGEKVNNGLLELEAPTAGSYAPGASFPTALRSAIVSAELLAK
jgi:hypothetical protein